MKLSVIIVNYNVKYFLEQCLHSVMNAVQGLEVEVFVVDNNSVDGSMEMVKQKFPSVICIENKTNLGFSAANNQAIKKSTGDYILLLNPDTLVEDTTFSKVIEFMDHTPDAGGLGVKMVDGKGAFLPESKRGLPKPTVAFYKIFGLSKLFPKSKVFGKYHLGYLDKDEVNEVEILSGAFMLIRKTVLDKIGLLDDTFFMYGEDIDLSYRITQAGFKNYYFPKTRIIHYKGESTKKSSVNYVFTFYNAMIIFARKHFSAKNAKTLSLLINIAVYFRASLALLNRFVKRVFFPALDTVLLLGGILAIKNYWEQHVVFKEGGGYPIELLIIAIPVYLLVWIFSVYMSGGYDKPVKLTKIFQGIFIGTIIILTGYSLLPENFRFSRAIILLGATWGLLSMTGIRTLLHLIPKSGFSLGNKENKRYLIVGEKDETLRVADLLRKTDIKPGFIGFVGNKPENEKEEGFIGHIDQIKDIINIYQIDELIFCAKDIAADIIIDNMSALGNMSVNFRIAPPESMSIIGSQSINTSGDAYIIELNSIQKINNKRNKRFLDILVSLALFFLLPVLLWFIKNPIGFIGNIFKVLLGKISWVGYKSKSTSATISLPAIKRGVLFPSDTIGHNKINEETTIRLDTLYARDYKMINDLNILLKGFKHLGRSAR